MSSLSAPLCPAGHLPLKGGDWPLLCSSPNLAKPAPTSMPPISPLEGEMPGRAEGGASRCSSLAWECVG
ncbi:MAG: lytic murein transglycosylase [Mesorhizobium sp.]|nr:MAG: lytic murein transglycosylase [Mesorhizobium sp.]